MLNELKKVFLLGIGSAAYSYEKAEGLVKEMVEKGKLTVNEGKELSEELKRNIQSKKEEVEQTIDQKVKPLTKEDMISVLKEMNFASRDDIEDIKNRLSKLEGKEENKDV
jgi:polyhydroxyalkanoate synthesis regulator phasin